MEGLLVGFGNFGPAPGARLSGGPWHASTFRAHDL